MTETATLVQYIGADTVRKVDGESNIYKLDGTKYIVPDTVLTTAETLQSGEGVRGGDVSSDPTLTDLVDFFAHLITEQRGRTLLEHTPAVVRAISEFSGLAINH